MRVLEGGFNFNWFEFDFSDSDGDGVLDENDACPNTPENAVVDVTGCEVFYLLPENFAVSTFSETCRSENNGSIFLSAIENYNYTVSLTAENYSETRTFVSEINFENLSAGTYTLCITITSQPGYEQCFTIVVIEPDELIVNAGRPANSSELKLSLSGGEVYYIRLNNENIVSNQTEISLQLSNGTNQLSVRTNKDCQGIYKKTIVANLQPLVYPNPVHNTLFISTNNLSMESVPVEIYNLEGKLIYSKIHKATSNELQIDLSSLTNGFSILKIVTKEDTYNYKIIKQ
jgi:hypothetical protein